MSKEYLDPEIANEGEKVVPGMPDPNFYDPNAENWQPRMKPPAIPTYEGIKSIEKYFPQFTGIPYKFQPYPAWLYHPTKPKKYVRNAEEAAKLGVSCRKSTREERNNGMGEDRWVYAGEWRSYPVKDEVFDPRNPGGGKNVMSGDSANHNPMSAASVQTMAAAMASAMAAEMAKGAKPNSDPDYNEFLEFKAWKAANKGEIDAIKEVVAAAEPDNRTAFQKATETVPPTRLTSTEERDILRNLAKEKGLKVDNRWSVDRLKAELESAGE